MKTSTFILGLSLVLLPAAAARTAEPLPKPVLFLALDEQAPSRMLRAELSRNWLRPNRAVALTALQKSELAVIGERMNVLQSQLRAQFAVVYVDADTVPLPERLHLPALRINHGRWETLDRRAFAFETRPLVTLDWYRSRYVSLFDRDATLDALAQYGVSDEGYSGPAQVETPAPWERKRNDDYRMTNNQ